MTKTSFTAADLTATLDELVASVVNPAIFALSQRFMAVLECDTGLATVIAHNQKTHQLGAK